MLTNLLIAAVVAVTPMSDNYYSDVSPETADYITESVISHEYYEYLDFNGDGELTIADAVGILQKYKYNCLCGNTMTFSEKEVFEIIWENFRNDEFVYYEIDCINGNPCIQYRVTAETITNCDVYIKFENRSVNVQVQINPFTESIRVI